MAFRIPAFMIALIAFASSVSVVHSDASWPPTGDYLRISDLRLYHYDALMGTMSSVGTVSDSYGCRSSGGTDDEYYSNQCGECTYFPSTLNYSWENVVSQYTYGRCASANMTHTSVTTRVDVQIVNNVGETGATWWYEIYARYLDSEGYELSAQGQPFTNPEPLIAAADGDCSSSPAIWCSSGVRTWNNVDNHASSIGADIYCVTVKVHKQVPGNLASVMAKADPCLAVE